MSPGQLEWNVAIDDTSFHYTLSRDMMLNCVAGDFNQVYVADNSVLDIVGKGDVELVAFNDNI